MNDNQCNIVLQGLVNFSQQPTPTDANGNCNIENRGNQITFAGQNHLLFLPLSLEMRNKTTINFLFF